MELDREEMNNSTLSVGDYVTIRNVGEDSPWEGLSGYVDWLDTGMEGDDFQTVTVRVNFPTQDGMKEILQNFDRKNLVKEIKEESLKESNKKQPVRYHYNGIVKRFGQIYADDFEGWTVAVSDRQALNNLAIKAKKKYGFKKDANMTLDPQFLEIDPGKDDSEVHVDEKPTTCKECGARLLDDGSCPVCDKDYGFDFDHLDEDIKLVPSFVIKCDTIDDLDDLYDALQKHGMDDCIKTVNHIDMSIGIYMKDKTAVELLSELKNALDDWDIVLK